MRTGKDLLRDMNGGEDISVAEILDRYKELKSTPEGREHIRRRAEEFSRLARELFGE